MRISRDMVHVGLALVTLAVSAFVAFGPLRHRLPRVLTRLARYSMAFKLGSLAVVGGVMLWHNVRDEGPWSARWVLSVLVVGFAVAAVRVLFVQQSGPAA